MADHPKNSSGDGQDKYNIAFGLLEPELKKFAEELRKFVPKISSQRVKRLIGILNAFVSSKTNNMHPLAGALLTQTTKIIDDVFLDDASPAHHEAEAVKVTTDAWITKMFAETGERLKKAADPEAERVKISQEFIARLSLLRMMEEEQKKYEAEKKAAHAPTTHTGEPLQIAEGVDNLLSEWKTRAQRRGYTTRRRKS